MTGCLENRSASRTTYRCQGSLSLSPSTRLLASVARGRPMGHRSHTLQEHGV